uniref:Putative glycosyltransferase n=1 Tax=viral metagenome TaxID=1070528 RepID=A0A6M3JUY3_9ZZZZ
MNIAFITNHNCMRVTKESLVLNDLGYSIHLITRALRGHKHFKTTNLFDTEQDLINIVKAMSKYIDIWHIHNHPNSYAVTVRTVLPKAKIVFDFHDSNYWFVGDEKISDTQEKLRWYTEDVAVEASDAFIVPGDMCKDELKTRTKKPIIVIPPAVPKKLFVSADWNVWGGLVSQGGHASSERTGVYKYNGWRDYGDLYKALIGKVKIFAYSPSFKLNNEDPIIKYYLNLGVHLNNFGYEQLLIRIGEHTWNLVGNLKKVRVMDYMMPNKLFDAIAAGCPSICLNAKSAGNFVEQYGIGISISTIEELLDRWDEHTEKRYNLMLKRDQFCMESYIDRLTKLYDKTKET